VKSRKGSDKTYASEDGKIVVTDPGYQKPKTVFIEDQCAGNCIYKLMNSTLEVDYTVSQTYENGMSAGDDIESTWKGQIIHTVLENNQ
jgi:hypothetical protein